MKEVNVEIDDDRDKVPVWLAGCIHFGGQTHNSRLLDKWLDYDARDKPYIVLMGDMIESALPGHHFSEGVWLQTQNPDEQIETCIDTFKDSDVVAVLRGNHERRIYNISSIDPAKLIAHGLGAAYLGFGGKINFNFKNGLTYSFAVFHGGSSTTNPKSLLDRAHKIYRGFDVLAVAHVHKLYSDVVQELRPDGIHKTYRVCCGSFLGYEQYAQERFYEPGIIGNPLIYLYKDKKIISVNTSGFPSEF